MTLSANHNQFGCTAIVLVVIWEGGGLDAMML